jgi:hypothetical protein
MSFLPIEDRQPRSKITWTRFSINRIIIRINIPINKTQESFSMPQLQQDFYSLIRVIYWHVY